MKRLSLFVLVVVTVFLVFLITKTSLSNHDQENNDAEVVEAIPEIIEPTDRVEQITIQPGDTYGGLMEEAVGASTAAAIYAAAQDLYDLAAVRDGRIIELYHDKNTDEFYKLVYQINTEEELQVIFKDAVWNATVIPIEYETEIVTKSGTIESSMYQTALDQDIDIRAIIELANAFQWSIDFALDPRKGDTFSFVYEERYRDGDYIGPGNILAGKYVNAGTEYYVYFFEENEENSGFFDQDGNSVQKMFLKAPVAFKYISSGFTTGKRYVAAFNVSTGHRAIDYAAAYGTPIRAVGDGTVSFAGWNTQGYGNLVSIRHNGTYSTNYAHQSKIAVRVGQKVKQGDTIGYVGSTGFSTGPHLHYEMVKNGVKINPLLEVLPPGKPLSEESRDQFAAFVEQYKPMLDNAN